MLDRFHYQYVPATALHRLREEAGFTQEELADLTGLLPAEIAARESGAIRLSRGEWERIRHMIDLAAYERQLPPPCLWMQANELRLVNRMFVGPRAARESVALLDAHRSSCDACRSREAAARALPPRPGETAGTWERYRTWRALLPVQARLLLGLAEGGGLAALALVGHGLFGDWRLDGRSPWHILGGLSVLWAFGNLGVALRELAEERPFAAGFLRAAGTGVLGMLLVSAFTGVPFAHPMIWLWSVPVMLGLGIWTGLSTRRQQGRELERMAEFDYDFPPMEPAPGAKPIASPP